MAPGCRANLSRMYTQAMQLDPQASVIAILVICILTTIIMYRLGVNAGALAATKGAPRSAAEAMQPGPSWD